MPCWSTIPTRTVRSPFSRISAATASADARCSSVCSPCRLTKPDVPTPWLAAPPSILLMLHLPDGCGRRPLHTSNRGVGSRTATRSALEQRLELTHHPLRHFSRKHRILGDYHVSHCLCSSPEGRQPRPLYRSHNRRRSARR